MSRRHCIHLACSIAFAAGLCCARAPLERICPALAPGDLVVTEIRGKQDDVDTYGEWIELYNATDEPIPLGGISVNLIKLDGSGDFHFLVRDPDVEIAARDYAVLSGTVAADKPFTTYAFGDEEDASLYDGAFVEIYSCEDEVDRMLYRSLPDQGTWSLDGASEPDAEDNDSTDDPIWCVDATPADPMGPMIEFGIRGTPGEANRPCPHP